MEHFAHIPPEEMLYLYIDGELGAEHDETLFSHLAASPEMRTEMRDLLALRHGVQKDMLLPDPSLKAKMLAAALATGPAVAESPVAANIGAATSTASKAVGSFSLLSHVAIPLASAFIGALVMFFALAPHDSHSAGNTAITGAVQQPVISTGAAPTVPEQNAVENAVVSARSERAQWWQHSVPHSIAAVPESRTTQEYAELDNGAANDTRETVERASMRPAVAAVNVQPAGMRDIDNIFTAPTEPRFQIFSREAASYIRLRVRSIAAESFPSVKLETAESGFAENLSVGVQYILDSEHSIGAEFGSESFAQVFTAVEKGKLIQYEQAPLLTWGGVAYSYRPALFGEGAFVHPFADVIAGAALPGFPLGRCALGVEVTPETQMSMLIGVEGSLLMYRHADAWFTTRKIGFTCGLSYRF